MNTENSSSGKKNSETKSVKIGKEQHRKLKIEAAKSGKTVQNLLDEMIDEKITD